LVRAEGLRHCAIFFLAIRVLVRLCFINVHSLITKESPIMRRTHPLYVLIGPRDLSSPNAIADEEHTALPLEKLYSLPSFSFHGSFFATYSGRV
jgi:hypothetical protein